MFSPEHPLAVGPLRCAWAAHRRGTPSDALVRPWLARALAIEDRALVLERDALGRPRLAIPGHADLDVSWSHSGDALLVALGAGVRVGADLEYLRPRPRALLLADRFFTAHETAQLRALHADAREAAFVRLWCAKEAVLKAHGHGLVFGLHRLAFTVEDGDWRMTACDPDLGLPTDWRLHAFTPMPGYVATLAWHPIDAAGLGKL